MEEHPIGIMCAQNYPPEINIDCLSDREVHL